MADPNQQRAVNTAFAPPPPLWKHFTRENLDRLKEIKTEASKDEDGRPNRNKQWSPAELRALDLAPELRFLVPPDIPTGEYSVFGELQTVSLARPRPFPIHLVDRIIAINHFTFTTRAGH